MKNKDAPSETSTNLACCYFYLGMYPESEKMVEKAPESKLRTRLQLHLANKTGNKAKINEYNGKLSDAIEDQLSLAAIHYLKADYQEAIDVYKRVMLDSRYVIFIFWKNISKFNIPVIFLEF